MSVTNSTVSGNSATGSAYAGFFGDGGGFYNYNGMLSVTNSTVSANSAYSEGGGFAIYDEQHAPLLQATLAKE